MCFPENLAYKCLKFFSPQKKKNFFPLLKNILFNSLGYPLVRMTVFLSWDCVITNWPKICSFFFLSPTCFHLSLSTWCSHWILTIQPLYLTVTNGEILYSFGKRLTFRLCFAYRNKDFFIYFSSLYQSIVLFIRVSLSSLKFFYIKIRDVDFQIF